MARYAELFADWGHGSWGDRGPYWAGRQEDGFFESLNLVVSDGHVLVPRQSMKEVSIAGMPSGEITSMFFAPIAPQVPVLVTIGNEVWSINLGTNDCSKIGEMNLPLDAPRTGVWSDSDQGPVFYLAGADGVYKISWPSGVVRVSSAITGLTGLVRHRERMYATTDRRIHYSDAADFTTWGPLSYFDVGWLHDTYRLVSGRNNLWVLRQDETNYAIGGSPDSTLTLRQASITTPPSEHSPLTQVDKDGAMWWTPQFEEFPVRMMSSGVGDDRLRRLSTWADAVGPIGSAYSYGPDTIVFHDDHSKALYRHGGVWTRQAFDVDVGFMLSRVSGNQYAATDRGGIGVDAKWYLTYLDTDAGVSRGRGGDGTLANNFPDCWLQLPIKEHRMGYEQRVVAVEVEFESFDWNHSQSAHFDLQVRAWHPSGDTVSATASRGFNASKAYTFDEVMSASSSAGDYRRRKFKVGDQGWGRGYQLVFENIRGVAIRSVTAVVDAEPRDTR